MSESQLDQRTILITGGSRGIGYHTAARALEAGARVLIGAKHPESLEQARAELHGHGELAAKAVDVSDYASMGAFIEEGLNRFERVDALVNDAGVAWSGSFAEMPREAIDAAVDVNVRGVLYGCRLALPHLMESGGTIVNLSSGAGRTGIPGLAAYSASKFAVCGLTEALAAEAGDFGVDVYAVCPGRVATEMQERVSGKRQGLPPERVAEAILSLLGPRPPIRPGECLEPR
ncbi:SDR family oxidoreductase [Thiohalorhabdus sp. Cl-TMA]|uniref:SDR family oxidoreductase n=1 Tax=Thiohalorhabdus methylotrophus TaxID=3242694 RepID=A0ABV4TZ16_9GAMM